MITDRLLHLDKKTALLGMTATIMALTACSGAITSPPPDAAHMPPRAAKPIEVEPIKIDQAAIAQDFTARTLTDYATKLGNYSRRSDFMGPNFLSAKLVRDIQPPSDISLPEGYQMLDLSSSYFHRGQTNPDYLIVRASEVEPLRSLTIQEAALNPELVYQKAFQVTEVTAVYQLSSQSWQNISAQQWLTIQEQILKQTPAAFESIAASQNPLITRGQIGRVISSGDGTGVVLLKPLGMSLDKAQLTPESLPMLAKAAARVPRIPVPADIKFAGARTGKPQVEVTDYVVAASGDVVPGTWYLMNDPWGGRKETPEQAEISNLALRIRENPTLMKKLGFSAETELTSIYDTMIKALGPAMAASEAAQQVSPEVSAASARITQAYVADAIRQRAATLAKNEIGNQPAIIAGPADKLLPPEALKLLQAQTQKPLGAIEFSTATGTEYFVFPLNELELLPGDLRPLTADMLAESPDLLAPHELPKEGVLVRVAEGENPVIGPLGTSPVKLVQVLNYDGYIPASVTSSMPDLGLIGKGLVAAWLTNNTGTQIVLSRIVGEPLPPQLSAAQLGALAQLPATYAKPLPGTSQIWDVKLNEPLADQVLFTSDGKAVINPRGGALTDALITEQATASRLQTELAASLAQESQRPLLPASLRTANATKILNEIVRLAGPATAGINALVAIFPALPEGFDTQNVQDKLIPALITSGQIDKKAYDQLDLLEKYAIANSYVKHDPLNCTPSEEMTYPVQDINSFEGIRIKGLKPMQTPEGKKTYRFCDPLPFRVGKDVKNNFIFRFDPENFIMGQVTVTAPSAEEASIITKDNSNFTIAFEQMKKGAITIMLPDKSTITITTDGHKLFFKLQGTMQKT